MNDVERQIEREANSVQEGLLRCAKTGKYQLATDLKPVNDLLRNALDSLMDAILSEQIALKTGQNRKLPNYGTAFLSLRPDQLALITISTLLNSIFTSEFEDDDAPRRTPVAYDIGQWCRIERILDCSQHREVHVAQEVVS